MRTLSQILIDSNSYLDLEAAEPTGDDLTVRTAYAQQAVREWADAASWKELSTPYYAFATAGTLSLPSNFKELEAKPKDSQGNFYPEVRPANRVYEDSASKYCYIEGNESSGYTVTFNNLGTLATLSLTYQRTPSNMATLTDICEVPDDQFVVKKIISMVLQSRSDERFPIVESEAQRLLKNMIGRNMVQNPGGQRSVRRFGASTWRIGTARG